MPATEARDAVLSALRIAGVDLASGGRVALPTARTRAAVDRLCDATPEKLAEERVDLRAIIRDLLDWERQRATKAVVRTAGKAMTATTADGASLWPHAIEALSYAAIWSPLLEPDRLDRVIAHAAANPTSAFAPIRYAAGPASKLQMLVGHYNAARLETLATSLWDAAHMGRWWDACGGLGAGGDGTRRRRRRRLDREELEAQMEARTRAITAAGGEPAEAVAAIVSGQNTHWNPATAEVLRRARLSGKALDEVIACVHEPHDDPDVAVLLAQLVDLPPGDRPENPVPAMIDALEFMLDGADPVKTLPKKPDGWGSLYPEGSLKEYPIPALVRAWDWAEFPDTPGAVIELIRTPHALFENRDYMGNCTGGYNQRCQTGTWVLGKVHYQNEMYNISIWNRGGGWHTSEINSRFNRGGVPQELLLGFRNWTAQLNAGARPEREPAGQ